MPDALEQATALQNLMVSEASGHHEDPVEYLALRKAVLAIPGADPHMPAFLRTCRSLPQFWQFIKAEFQHYAERKHYIWDNFRPLLDHLEAAVMTSSDSSAAPHTYYSHRSGTNPNIKGLPMLDIFQLYRRVHAQYVAQGYFTEAFGFYCVGAGHIDGKFPDPELEILLTIKKKDLWPIEDNIGIYSEEDFFDMLEFFYQHVSKPVKGTPHDYGDCGMHWHTFNKRVGQAEYRARVNFVLDQYAERFQLTPEGEVLRMPEAGMEPIFDADLPTKDQPVLERVAAAVHQYRRHGSGVDDRRQAVRDLADVLERLRPQVKAHLSRADEADLFQIANNFAIRHFNDTQKTGYDAPLWHSWMFYFYLSTIHVVLRKIEEADPRKTQASASSRPTGPKVTP